MVRQSIHANLWGRGALEGHSPHLGSVAVHIDTVDGLEISDLKTRPRLGRLEKLICQKVVQLKKYDCHGFEESLD